MPSNISELEQYMVEEWENIPNEFLTNLISSMRDHCQQVIDNNGE